LDKQLEPIFDLLEKQRSQFIEQLKNCPPGLLNRKVAADQWSPNQVIQHLILAESLSLKSVQAKLVKGNFQKGGFTSTLRNFLLRIFLRSPLKFKAPVKVSVFPEELHFNKLCAEWELVRRQWKVMLEEIPPNLLGMYLFKHPAVGKMLIKDGLWFIYEHVRRHQLQVLKSINTDENI